MLNKNTCLKNVTPAGDYSTTYETVIGKSNAYQHSLLIATGSLLVVFLWVAVVGTSGGQYLQIS